MSTKDDSASLKLLTVPEVAERLRVSKPTAYMLIETGRLRALRLGRCVRVHESDFAAFVLEYTKGGPSNTDTSNTDTSN